MSPPLGKVLMLLLAPLYLIIILTSLTFFLWPLLHSCNFSRKLRRMLAFKRNSEGLNLLISKGVVVECMTLFTKMSLKEYLFAFLAWLHQKCVTKALSFLFILGKTPFLG